MIISLQIPSFADSNSTQIIDQYLNPTSNNSASQILLPVGNTTLLPETQIEIGQTVKWIQVVTLNDTEDSVAVEIPEDAQVLEITIEGPCRNHIKTANSNFVIR